MEMVDSFVIIGQVQCPYCYGWGNHVIGEEQYEPCRECYGDGTFTKIIESNDLTPEQCESVEKIILAIWLKSGAT